MLSLSVQRGTSRVPNFAKEEDKEKQCKSQDEF